MTNLSQQSIKVGVAFIVIPVQVLHHGVERYSQGGKSVLVQVVLPREVQCSCSLVTEGHNPLMSQLVLNFQRVARCPCVRPLRRETGQIDQGEIRPWKRQVCSGIEIGYAERVGSVAIERVNTCRES